MNNVEIFSSGKNSIDIQGMDDFIQFSRYDPYKPELFLHGIELYENLITKYGTILYARGTKITPKHLERLLQLRESNPNLDFPFILKKNAELIQSFRNEIKENLFILVNRQTKKSQFKALLSQINVDIESFIDDILADENITLALYHTRYTCNNSEKKKSTLFFEHSLNVAIFSLAIASSFDYSKIIDKDKSKLADIFKVGLFHNYGSLSTIDSILKAPDDTIFDLYWEANRKGYSAFKHTLLNYDILNAFRLLGNYHKGQKDFIKSTDWPAVIANIVLVADTFITRENGLFSESQSITSVVDYLNIKVTENEFNLLPVLTLTKGLNLRKIFDFYKELNNLIKECPYNSGVAYPLRGFKSPTLFVCKKGVNVCKHLDQSKKAVNLSYPLGELKPGNYHMCLHLTNKLMTFYKKHYVEIKEVVAVNKKPQ